MTPTPIPEDNSRTPEQIWHSRNPCHDFDDHGIDRFYKTAFMCMQDYADQEVAKAVASQQTMRWVDAEDDLPRDQSIEYFVRWRKDGEWAKLTAFYDNDAKEFYTVEQNCRMEYMSTKEFKGLQWLDESPAPIQ